MLKKNGSDDLVKFSRLTSNEIHALYTPGEKCNIKSAEFEWMLFDDGKAKLLVFIYMVFKIASPYSY